MIFGARTCLLRDRKPHEHSKVTFVELFFDLVFVFAITQLSHYLLDHFSVAGVLQTALMLMAVWWVWIYTSWATNWLDPQTTPVRIALFVLMLAGLVLSISIPDAFGTRGIGFAAAYVTDAGWPLALHAVGVARHDGGNYRNFQRITSWFVLSALFWIAGAFADGQMRFALWAVALAIEYAAPAAGFWTPGLGRSTTAEWDISGAHIAERCGLFIIIALGKSILVTGATFGKMDWTAATIAAFAIAFIGSVAMWWIYFNIGAERAAEYIAASDDPGRHARVAYTYTHLLPGGRHHRHRGVGRTDPGASRRSHRFQDRGDDADRAGFVSGRQSDLQAAARRQPRFVAHGRNGAAGACSARGLVRAAAGAWRDHERDPGRGRDLGDALAWRLRAASAGGEAGRRSRQTESASEKTQARMSDIAASP